MVAQLPLNLSGGSAAARGGRACEDVAAPKVGWAHSATARPRAGVTARRRPRRYGRREGERPQGGREGGGAEGRGDTHPHTPTKTAAQHPTGSKTGAVDRKFHCRTTLRQSAPTEQDARVYKRKRRRAGPYTNTNVNYRFVNEGPTRKHRRGAAKEQTARTSTTANPAAERPL